MTMAEDGSTPFAKLWAHSIHFLSRLIFVFTRVKHELCVVKANYEQLYRLIMNSLLLKFVNLNLFFALKQLQQVNASKLRDSPETKQIKI